MAMVRTFFFLSFHYQANLGRSKELNVQEIRPPRMDDSGRVKYPVLFRVSVILFLGLYDKH